MNTGLYCALAGAALFGASTPVAKLLLGEIQPVLLAGLLYVGSGLGLGGGLGLRGLVGPGPWPALAVALACLCWAVDNNLTRKISAGDAVKIASFKGLVAGTISLGVSAALGTSLPAPGLAAAAAFVGLLGYGVSLVFFVVGL